MHLGWRFLARNGKTSLSLLLTVWQVTMNNVGFIFHHYFTFGLVVLTAYCTSFSLYFELGMVLIVDDWRVKKHKNQFSDC